MMRRFPDMFSAEECYSETMSCPLKSLVPKSVGFDNLLAAATIVGMRINIDAMNSEETQRMPELMAASKLLQYLFVKTKQQH